MRRHRAVPNCDGPHPAAAAAARRIELPSPKTFRVGLLGLLPLGLGYSGGAVSIPQQPSSPPPPAVAAVELFSSCSVTCGGGPGLEGDGSLLSGRRSIDSVVRPGLFTPSGSRGY